MDIYKKLAKLTEFDWDTGNTDKNPAKHMISNLESEEVFFNAKLVFPDEGHSNIEERFYLLGQANQGRVLSVVFTIRKHKIRVISSRIANRKERQVYRNYYKYEKDNSKI